MTQTPRRIKYNILIPGVIALLAGGFVLVGWWFDFPSFTRLSPDWTPMAPSTALCFGLSGLVLLQNMRDPRSTASVAQTPLIGLVVLLAGARCVELALGRDFGIESLLSGAHTGDVMSVAAHMSQVTAAGFMLFAIGMLIVERARSRRGLLVVRVMAGAMLALGAGGVVGYWLNFNSVFEPFYIATGLVWLAFPTALGLFLLGVALLCLALLCGPNFDSDSIKKKSAEIYYTAIFVLSATAVVTGLIGISFVERSVYTQAVGDMEHSLDGARTYIDTAISGHVQRALVASLDPAFQTRPSVIGFAAKTSAPPGAQANHVANELLAHGFTAISIEHDGQSWLLAGHRLPDATRYVALKGETGVALAWNRGYYLRVRVPQGSVKHGMPGSYIVFEQTLAPLNLNSSVTLFQRPDKVEIKQEVNSFLAWLRGSCQRYSAPEHASDLFWATVAH